MTTPTQATCTNCHNVKPISELNGYDPMTGDTSHAYCMNLAECDSNFAREQIQAITDMLQDGDVPKFVCRNTTEMGV